MGGNQRVPEDQYVRELRRPDATVWDLPALRRRYGEWYEIYHIGLTWYAWPHDGHLTRAITAGTGEKLRTRIISDLASPRPGIPLQRQEK